MINIMGWQVNYEAFIALLFGSFGGLLGLIAFVRTFGKPFFDRHPILRSAVSSIDGNVIKVSEKVEDVLSLIIEENRKLREEYSAMKNLLQLENKVLVQKVESLLEINKLAYTPSEHANKQAILSEIEKARKITLETL
jgi:hypothetical protein